MEWEKVDTLALAAQGLTVGLIDNYIVQEIKRSPATAAWLTVGAFVLAYDIWCPEGQTLSEGFDKLVDRHPLIASAGALAVTGHLLNWWKPKDDPIHKLVEAFR
jgi:hypothetical protein